MGEPINTPGDRFIVLSSYNNQAVYDKETGLVWEQSPSDVQRTWDLASEWCILKSLGGRRGWRLPTVQELDSLFDPSQPSALPAQHPFSNIKTSMYWSATFQRFGPNVLTVTFTSGPANRILGPFQAPALSWCVRGGQGAEPQ